MLSHSSVGVREDDRGSVSLCGMYVYCVCLYGMRLCEELIVVSIYLLSRMIRLWLEVEATLSTTGYIHYTFESTTEADTTALRRLPGNTTRPP